MGTFSWKCGVCKQAILHNNPRGYRKFSQVTCFIANGDVISGDYDGYGRVRGIDMADSHPPFKIVHTCCAAGKSYATLPEIGPFSSCQGYFPGEALALERYGQPNMDECKDELNYSCLLCDRAWRARWSGGVCKFGCRLPEDPEDKADAVAPLGWCWYSGEAANSHAYCPSRECRMFQTKLRVSYVKPGELCFPRLPRCGNCATNLERVKLLWSPLEQLAVESSE